MLKYNFKKGQKLDIKELLESRASTSYEAYEQVVRDVLNQVSTRGQEALYDYTKQFDGVEIQDDNFRVTEDEIKSAYNDVSPELVAVMKKAAKRISDYHELQIQKSWYTTDDTGSILGQQITPLDSVGVYVPGGKNAFPSSVLMNVLPAKVAGVKRIVMTTPPKKDGDGSVESITLVAADIAGVTDIFKVGGAQAIGALAYGTKDIQPVCKIVGPGNIYVALAKKEVFGHVGIDSIAGPSEILVIADETANPKFVAADLLSQAEHDELASSVLITTSKRIAEDTMLEIDRQLNELPRKDIAKASLDNYGAVIIVDAIEDAASISNSIAPEHLELYVTNPFATLPLIKNAGAIFMGEYSPEPLGDYMAGPNHILPTNGTAKFFAPLSVDDFIKKSSIINFTKIGLQALSDDIQLFAKSEFLDAHANAVKVRFEDER